MFNSKSGLNSHPDKIYIPCRFLLDPFGNLPEDERIDDEVEYNGGRNPCQDRLWWGEGVIIWRRVPMLVREALLRGYEVNCQVALWVLFQDEHHGGE